MVGIRPLGDAYTKYQTIKCFNNNIEPPKWAVFKTCFFTLRKKSCVLDFPSMKLGVGIFVIGLIVGPFVAVAEDYYGVYDDDINLYTGLVRNYGTLNGTIHITDGANVVFENYGQINSLFDYGNNILVSQYITGVNNLNKIYNLTGHTINVLDANNINMFDLVYTAENAVQINLENSLVVVDSSFQNFSVPINIVGSSVTLCVNGNPENWLGTDVPVLSNISGLCSPYILVANDNPLYATQSHLTNGTLYVSSVRQTNYLNMMSNHSLGEYLNELQSNNPDDPLIAALNNATNMSQINSILEHSPKTNPIKLMDAVKTVNSLKIANSVYTPDSGVYIKSGYALSDNFVHYNMNVNLTSNLTNDLMAMFGVDVGYLDYTDKHANASAMLYSGNLGVYYDSDEYFISLFGDVSYAQFYGIEVFDGTKVVENPYGISETVVLDSGMKLQIFDVVNVSPFIGLRMNNVELMGQGDFDMLGRLGFNLNHESKFDDNVYSVGLDAYAESNNTFYAGVRTNVLSSADGLSGGAGLGALYDDMGWTYQITLNIKFLF